jgi:phosphate:Na+ symporter
MRADHRAEHRDSNQLGDGGDWREQHGKRLALAYILFKLIAAVIALVLFPFVTPLLIRASSNIDGVTLLAAYHTAYNIVGVAVLLPVIDKFTQFVERILPERSSPLTRGLDHAALATPIVAVEAVRRTVARALATMCGSVEATLVAAGGGMAPPRKDAISVAEAAAALRQAQVFLSDVSGPPETGGEQRRLTATLHALDHAARLSEIADGGQELKTTSSEPEDMRAAQLCAGAMRDAAEVAGEIAALSAAGDRTAPIEPPRGMSGSSDTAFDRLVASTAEALVRLEHCARTLGELRDAHRSATLGAVAAGALTADQAIVRVDKVRRLEMLAHHAWRSTVQLVGYEPHQH